MDVLNSFADFSIPDLLGRLADFSTEANGCTDFRTLAPVGLVFVFSWTDSAACLPEALAGLALH